ncbi:MAG: hypothetical protein HQ517_10815 [SAR324 cluster bacterium]|nr:hypothetical protein [SAR324 cluster bacterium]
MKSTFLTVLLVILIGFSTGHAQSKTTAPIETAPTEPTDETKPTDESVNITYVSPKKVIMVPGSLQKISKGKESLIIEYEKLHKTGNFPIIRIQGVPFKLREKGDNLVFTWHQVGYEVVWAKSGEEVILMSSEEFKRKTFSVKNKDVRNSVIFKGLVVETKRSDGSVSKLEVVDVVQSPNGKMEKFSVRTYANKDNPAEFQNENNILSPEFHKQYEKGINDEVLYIFTSNNKGEVFVYYR